MPPTNVKRALRITSIVVAAQDQVSSDLAGEAIILSLQTGKYYGLARVAARIWELLKTPTRVPDIRDTIVQQFDVEPERCERDLFDFMQHLADDGLIEIRDGTDP
jgi:hypothetical protein